jgi:hypothetical protein
LFVLADENGEMEKKAMIDYVMNSSFWPSLCHEDKVLPPQLWDSKKHGAQALMSSLIYLKRFRM